MPKLPWCCATSSRPCTLAKSGDPGARRRALPISAAMTWCQHNRVGYVFGLAGDQVLLARVADLAEDAALGRVAGESDKVRRYGEFRCAARGWQVERRVIGRVEASPQGSDSRFIITNLAGAPRWLYENVYCRRGQAENLIKAHKLHLASDRTSCTSATANQFRLLIHTAAYWLLHTLRGLAPKTSFWRHAQFDTIPHGPDQGRRPGRRWSPGSKWPCRPAILITGARALLARRAIELPP